MDGKIDMTARRQVTNELCTRYRQAPNVDSASHDGQLRIGNKSLDYAILSETEFP